MNLWEKIKQSVPSVRKSAPAVEALELSRLQAEVEQLRQRTKEEFTALGGEVYVLFTTGKQATILNYIQGHVERLEILRRDLEAQEQNLEALHAKYEAQSVSMKALEEFKNELETSGGSLESLMVDAASPCSGKKLCEIEFPAEVLFGLIIRQGAALIPHHDTQIMAGDKIVFIGKKEAVIEILHKFKAGDK
jgi:K+/H+ antiporter YhaU regulatory subunit KhtT